MNSQLQTTLSEHFNSGWQNNDALKTLVHDYTKYHAVLLLAGGVVLLTSLILTTYFWIKFRKVPKIRRFNWPFEKRVYFSFGVVLTLFSMFFVLVFAANLSTVLKPLPGFTSLALSTTLPSDSESGTELIQWVKSNESTPPTVLKRKIQNRINWQRPKAIICGLLLIVMTIITVLIWKYLIERSRTDNPKLRAKEKLLIVAGSASFFICLLLAIMTVANTQGAIAPVVISILGAGG